MKEKRVRKAVIPAAGLGTRFLPATKAVPKEMIPIIDIPMIQYIVQEAVSAGIEDIILITARQKEAIENHFDYNYELEDWCERRQKSEFAELSRSIGRLCNVVSIRQKNPAGLGHAVLCAESVVGDEPFAVLLGDDLIDSNTPCIRQLIDVAHAHQSSVVGVMEVPNEDTGKYGIIAGDPVSDRLHEVSHLVEKPSPQSAPSRLAIPGRYVLSASIFEYLKKTPPGRGGEIQLTDALDLMAKEERLLGYQFEGTRYDTGDRMGYLDATIAFALKRPDLADGMRSLMKKHLGLG